MTTVRSEVESVNELADRMTKGHLSRRQFLVLASSVSSTALLAACSGGVGAANSGSSKVVPLYSTENDPATLAFYKMVIADFEKKHTGLKVKLTLYQDSNQLSFLQTAFRTGTDVGVFAPPMNQVSGWARQGQLLPVTDEIRRIGTGDFYAGSRVIVDGQDYGMPFQADSWALYYRKDLLAQAGLQPPTTHDQFLEAVKTLNGRNGTVGIASAVGPTSEMVIGFLAPYVFQSGWDYFDKTGNLTFNQSDVLGGVQRYVDIMSNTLPSFYNAGYEDIINSYVSGRAAFAWYPGALGVTCFNQAPNIASKTGVIGIPAGSFMNGRLSYGAIRCYSIYSKTKNPEAAKELLAALTTGPNAVEFAMTVPGHLLPALHSVMTLVKQRIANPTDAYTKAHADWIQTFIDLLPTAMSPELAMGSVNDHQYSHQLSNICQWAGGIWGAPPIDATMLQQILIQKTPVETAWQDACKKMSNVRQQWLATKH